MKNLAEQLERRRQDSLYRVRAVLDGPQQPEVSVNGETLLSFCSNDYLGLANHPDIIDALHRGLDRYGVGSGASHLVTGHSRAHHELEAALADFVQRSRAREPIVGQLPRPTHDSLYGLHALQIHEHRLPLAVSAAQVSPLKGGMSRSAE